MHFVDTFYHWCIISGFGHEQAERARLKILARENQPEEGSFQKILNGFGV